MKKLIILASILLGVSILSHFYIVQYYCVGDDYCIYRLGDGVSKNLLYLSATFLLATLISLIGRKIFIWAGIFVLMSLLTLSTNQTCGSVGCFNREILLALTFGLTVVVSLSTNLWSRFKR